MELIKPISIFPRVPQTYIKNIDDPIRNRSVCTPDSSPTGCKTPTYRFGLEITAKCVHIRSNITQRCVSMYENNS